MMKQSFLNNNDAIALTLILILASALRFYGLTHQSLWVDELHTMIEADPEISWGMMLDYLKCCDPHPPLYFIIERIFFLLFGHTEFVARSLSATCGLVSVWAMYLLGKELMNPRLGLISALLTSINHFNIDFSQEARCYIMAFLFAVLSYLYFMRLIKTLLPKHLYLYVLFTVLMLYSHYFSLFVVAAQGLATLVFLLGGKENQGRFFRVFATAGILIFIAYLPWIPFLLDVSNLHNFWIGPVKPDFAFTFIVDYFGNLVLVPFTIPLLVYFFWQVAKERDWSPAGIKESPLKLAFFVLFSGVAVTYIVPYVRSLLVVPMLLSRYTIVVLPAFIIAIALAFVLIKNHAVQRVLLTSFVLVSLIYQIFLTGFYNEGKPRKTQFRELTEFISQDPRHMYPIVEDRTGWQHSYYLNKYHYTGPVLDGNKEATVDSILQKRSPKYDLEGFWIVGAHNADPHLDPAMRARLDSTYQLSAEREFYDAWAQLFVRK